MADVRIQRLAALQAALAQQEAFEAYLAAWLVETPAPSTPLAKVISGLQDTLARNRAATWALIGQLVQGS